MKVPDSIDDHWLEIDVGANRIFWKRFGGRPDMKGAAVLDIGSCRGSLCVDMAAAGAARVTGLDINPEFVDYARAMVVKRYPELVGRVAFQLGALSQFPAATFDYIVSKDVFEHVMDLPALLAEIRRCLKPGGRLYAGYGPLFYAPNGAHGTFGPIPWGHLFLPDTWLLAMANHGRAQKVASLDELNDWNRLSFSEHRDRLHGAGLRVVAFTVNQSGHPVSRLFSLFRHVPGLRNYFTHNIYCVLEKESKE